MEHESFLVTEFSKLTALVQVITLTFFIPNLKKQAGIKEQLPVSSMIDFRYLKVIENLSIDNSLRYVPVEST